RCVQAGARSGRRDRGHAGDGVVRRRRRAVAAATRCAAERHSRAGLVARRGALRTRAADRSLPWRGRRTPGCRGGSRTGAGEVAIVAWALAGMPAQTRGAMPLGAAYIFARPGRHWAPGTPRRRTAGLPRAEPGSAGPLRRPAPEWRTDLDRLRGEFGQRDHRQAHEQETADALEQSDRAALPRRTNSGAERYARGRLPPSLSRLPPCERRRGSRIDLVMNPTGLHALALARRLGVPEAVAVVAAAP